MKLTALILAAVLLAACSRLTLENYSRIAMGQEYAQVTALLGEPSRCDEVIGVRQCHWGDDNKGVSVNFVGGKVILFSAHNLK